MEHLLRNSLLTGALALVALSSCINESDQPTLGPNSGTRTYNRRQLEAVVLEAGDASAQWTVNDSVVAKGATYTFPSALPGTYHVAYTVGGEKVDNVITVTPRFTRGAFLLNEGNMSPAGGHGVGSLTYIDPQERIVLPYAYYKVNGENLGNVCEDIKLVDGKLYIISQNGHTEDGRGNGNLTIADATTLKRIDVLGTEKGNVMAKQWTSHLAVAGDSIYLRGNNGILVGSQRSRTFTLIDGTRGALKRPMVTIGQAVYAVANTGRMSRVLQLQDGKVTATLTLPNASPNGIATTSDGKGLLVAQIGPNGKVFQIAVAPGELSIQETYDLPGIARNVNFGASNTIYVYRNYVYYASSRTEISRYDLTTKTSEVVRDLSDTNQSNFGLFYNSLAVNPYNGDLYYAAIKGYGLSYLENVTVWAEPKAGGSYFAGEASAYFPAAFCFIP